jgi:hypothetical protein
VLIEGHYIRIAGGAFSRLRLFVFMPRMTRKKADETDRKNDWEENLFSFRSNQKNIEMKI